MFPVRNIGKKNKDNTPSYESIGNFNTALVNTNAIKNNDLIYSKLKEKSIHELLDFNGIVFADSGGFDLYKNPKKELKPYEILEVQEKMKADIYGTLDIPIHSDKTLKQKIGHLNKNIEYAICMSKQKKSNSLLFASIHGKKPSTIRNSIKYLDKKGEFDGYALGGLVPIRNNYSKIIELILAARNTTQKPLHIYGLGGYLFTLILMYIGADTFDSSSFIRTGSYREYYLPGHKGIQIKEFSTLDRPPCSCPICSKHSLNQIRDNRDLITQHNLYALDVEIKKFKAIAQSNKDIEEYLESRLNGCRSTYRAFKIAKKKIRRL